MNRRSLAKLLTQAARAKLWLCLVFCPLLLVGQTNNSPATYPANRYLLVVETSRSMQRRSEAMSQAVQRLLVSALPGQARRGDSLGVWTFNEELYAGVMPLQKWSPETQKAVTDRVAGFLKAQKFEKRSRLDKVFPVLNRLVQNSPFITVILVCVGDDEVHGTPFDQRINEFFRTWRLQQQDALTPFVIVLRAQAGRFVDCSMNPAPWPPELPPLPKELLVAIPAARPPATGPAKQVAPVVPSLIISGKKPAASLPLKSEETTQPKPQVAAAVATDLPPQVRPAVPDLLVPPPQEAGVPTIEKGPEVPTNPKPVPPLTATFTDAAPVIKSAASAPPLVSPKPPLTDDQTATLARSNFTATSAQIGTVPSGRPGLYSGLLWVSGLVFLGAVMATVWICRRRSRSPREISLITESIDRRKE